MSALRQLEAAPARPEHFNFLAVDFPAERFVPIKSYYKYELAELYGVSMVTLVKFIQPFIADFEAIGYNKFMKIMSPRMVALLFEKIGCP